MVVLAIVLGASGLIYLVPLIRDTDDRDTTISLKISALKLIVDPSFLAPNSSIPRILVLQDQKVILTFESDEDLTFRVLGYNLEVDIGPTRIGSVLRFNASIPGSHDLELLLPPPEGEINFSVVRVGILVVSSNPP